MSEKCANGVGEEGPYSFVYEDQLWNFSNPCSAGDCKLNENKSRLESNLDSLSGHVGKKRERTGRAMKGSSSRGCREDEDSDHEIHIVTERERRKKMKDMFSDLHSLLPQLPMKVDKSTIVDEAVNYIKTLEETLQELQKKKAERIAAASAVPFVRPSPVSREAFLADQGKILADQLRMNIPSTDVTAKCFQTWISPNVTLNVTGDDAQFGICTAKKPGLLSTILDVLEKHRLDLVSAHVSSDRCKVMIMIHANANRVRVQIQGSSMIEGIYKSAAGELSRLLLSTYATVV